MIVWGFLLIAIICLIAFLRSPKGKGILGEWLVKIRIGKTRVGHRYVLNNYIIEEQGRTSQIDHILINSYGVFVIETKNYAGMIYGTEEQREWTQVLAYGKVKNKFYNPIKQNATHLYRIANVLPQGVPLFSVVVFTKANISNVVCDRVVKANRLQQYIKLQDKEILSITQMEEIYHILQEKRSLVTTAQYVESIKKMQGEIEENICPHCHKPLVKRNGRYGEFFACPNYPQCKFKKK